MQYYLLHTFTAYPQWKEIEDELYPGQTAADRPELTCDVFYCKFRALLTDIEDGCFARVRAKV